MKDLTPLVDRYIQVRDAKKTLVSAHKAELQKYDAALDQMGAVLMRQLNDVGANSIRTDVGTVLKKTSSSVTINDRGTFLSWLKTTGQFDCLTLHANKTECERMLQETGTLPPGLERWEEMKVEVRRA